MKEESVSKLAAMEPIPAAVSNAKQIPKLSFFSRLFGGGSQKLIESIQLENQELISINQRNVETIKSLSDQLSKVLHFQHNKTQEITKNLMILENIPDKLDAKFESLQRKILDTFDRATFFIQNTSQGLLEAKNELVTLQNDAFDGMGALEIAEFMRSFLVVNLLAKQVKTILQNVNDEVSFEELENAFKKLQKNFQVVKHQMEQVNFKLEKYNLKIEESILKPFQSESQSIELTEHCTAKSFYKLVDLCQKYKFLAEDEHVHSLIIAEIIPTISFFNRDKGSWMIQRRGRIVVLTPSNNN